MGMEASVQIATGAADNLDPHAAKVHWIREHPNPKLLRSFLDRAGLTLWITMTANLRHGSC
jgi:hypothetical protein